MRIDKSAFAVLVAAVLVSGCGFANPFAPANAANNREANQLKWAQCMRDHGINVSDSGLVTNNGPADGGGRAPAGQTQGSGNSTDDQHFQDAINACKKYAPNGGQGPARIDQRQIDAATKFAQCMRDHGIPMQDPQTSSDGGISMKIGGDPSSGIDPNSDQFKQAQQACQHFMDEARPKNS